jgi:CheY-like chemotaxis protein
MALKKILVADDSSTMRMLAQVLLRRGPYEVTTAIDGAEAVRQAVTDPPDLILMDVEMPRMTGIQACRALRANPKMRELPIIMVTTHAEEPVVRAAFASECSDYVCKPIDAGALLAKIRRFLGE